MESGELTQHQMELRLMDMGYARDHLEYLPGTEIKGLYEKEMRKRGNGI
jgi:hypothetical protein